MLIFYTVSRSALHSSDSKFKKIYLRVLKEIESQGVRVITTIRKEHYPKALQKLNIDLTTDEKQYKYVNDKGVKQAILKSDATVIEASYPSFRLGFETMYAVAHSKPVLVLSQTRNYGNLIDQPHFFGAKYNWFTLPDEIAKFVHYVKRNKLRHRFNLFISNIHKDHLEKIAKFYGISMSDYVRKLIETDALKKLKK